MEKTSLNAAYTTVNQTKSFKLIEGTFEPTEAANILFTILRDKIKFHTVQILSIQERFNGDTKNSERRLQELRDSKKEIEILIETARDHGYQIEINSSIDILLKKTHS